MNAIYLQGTVKFAPRTFSAGVGVVIQPDGETSGVDVTCWTEDAPDAARALGELHEGDNVKLVGKLVRKKEKRMAMLDANGVLVKGKDAWVLGVNVVSVDGVEQREGSGEIPDDF